MKLFNSIDLQFRRLDIDEIDGRDGLWLPSIPRHLRTHSIGIIVEIPIEHMLNIDHCSATLSSNGEIAYLNDIRDILHLTIVRA